MTATSDQNKATTVRFFVEVMTGQQFDLIPKILSPDYTFNGAAQNNAALIGWITSMHADHPGLSFLVETILAEDESVALRWRLVVPPSSTNPSGGYFLGTNIIVFAGGMAISNCQNDMLGKATFVSNPA